MVGEKPETVPPETPLKKRPQTLLLAPPVDCTVMLAWKGTPLAWGLAAPKERMVMFPAAAIRSVATEAASIAVAAHRNRMKRHRSKALETLIALSCPAGPPSVPTANI